MVLLNTHATYKVLLLSKAISITASVSTEPNDFVRRMAALGFPNCVVSI
jgi:hypothetical protein